jgi:hypothetical protein
MGYTVESAHGRYRVWSDDGRAVLILPAKNVFRLEYPGYESTRKIIGWEPSVECSIRAAELYLSRPHFIQPDLFES